MEFMNTRLEKKIHYCKEQLTGIAKKCDWFIHFNQCINSGNTSSPKTIFINTYYADLEYVKYRGNLDYFITTFLPNLKNEFVLIIAGEDYTFPRGTCDLRYNQYSYLQTKIQTLLNNEFLKHIFVENLDTLNPKMSPIPLGLLQYNKHLYDSEIDTAKERDILCFCKSVLNDTYQWEDRRKVDKFCKNEWKNFIYSPEDFLPELEFKDTLLRSKFCICVHGGGIDPSPKAFQAMLCGCIPIIQHSTLDWAYSRYPIVFVDEFTSESITLEKLENWYQELRGFYSPENKKELLNKLSIDYWWNIITSKTKKSITFSHYRLGDVVMLELMSEDLNNLYQNHPNTLGWTFIHERYVIQDRKLEKIVHLKNVIDKYIENNKFDFPKDLENSTVIHLRLGDVLCGNKWFEIAKRPLNLEELKNKVPKQGKIYVIGRCHFGHTGDSNQEESLMESEKYLKSTMDEFNAEHFDSGNPDIDLVFALKCKTFVQGRGYFSKMILELRKLLGLLSVECEVCVNT